MPINGLTNREPSFPEIGNIRKGAPKSTDKRVIGKDLTYFRVTFKEGEEEAAEAFLKAYGKTPRLLNVLIPFDDLDRVWEAWNEAYVTGALVHRCNRNPRTGEGFVHYAIDPATGRPLVYGGLSTDTGERVPCQGVAMTCKGGQMVPYLAGKKQEPIKCSQEGRLRVIIKELARLAYLTLHTTSINDIYHLDEQLRGIKRTGGGRLAGMPLVIRRRLEYISTPGEGGKRVRRKSWLLSIEPDGDWVRAKIETMKKASYPALSAPAEVVPTVIIEGEVVDVTTGEILDEEDIGGGNGTEGEAQETVTKPKKAPTKKKPTTNGNGKHWVEQKSTRESFWGVMHDGLGLSDEEVHEALGVEHISDYAGSGTDAIKQVRKWVDSQIEAEEKAEQPELAMG